MRKIIIVFIVVAALQQSNVVKAISRFKGRQLSARVLNPDIEKLLHDTKLRVSVKDRSRLKKAFIFSFDLKNELINLQQKRMKIGMKISTNDLHSLLNNLLKKTYYDRIYNGKKYLFLTDVYAILPLNLYSYLPPKNGKGKENDAKIERLKPYIEQLQRIIKVKYDDLYV